MRITIDTQEDSYEDALGVLRRAYGRHRVARKTEESPAVAQAVDVSTDGAVAEESGNRSASGAGGGDTGLRKPSAKGVRKAAGKRTSATRAAAEPAVSKPTGNKKTARSARSHGRPGGARKRSASGVAANTAPRGQSEAVRAWAQEQGMQVSARGRMPAKVITAYLEAHND